jgi:hypothetical protein
MSRRACRQMVSRCAPGWLDIPACPVITTIIPGAAASNDRLFQIIVLSNPTLTVYYACPPPVSGPSSMLAGWNRSRTIYAFHLPFSFLPLYNRFPGTHQFAESRSGRRIFVSHFTCYTIASSGSWFTAFTPGTVTLWCVLTTILRSYILNEGFRATTI